jgi:hypothetical protein
LKILRSERLGIYRESIFLLSALHGSRFHQG